MMKRILLTGADGMLAADLAGYLATQAGWEMTALTRAQLDITRRADVASALSALKPDAVIHAAAMTNVDDCENRRDEAFRVNGYGTENIAYYAHKAQARLVYISSCGLFGDEIKPYAEYDPVVLKTVYARSKYFGEEKTREWSRRSYIVRPGWLFGGTKAHRKNFVYNRMKEALQAPRMQSAADKFGCPTYTRHLARTILSLIETDEYGVYHLTNGGYGSRFDYVSEILRSFGLTTTLEAADSSQFPRPAPVPDCEILHNHRLTLTGLPALPDWREALDEYVCRLKREG